MKRYVVKTERKVEKWLAHLRDGKMLKRLGATIDGLADNPRPFGAIKLAGTRERYRLRVGNYRILYEIFDETLLVLVVDVGDRKTSIVEVADWNIDTPHARFLISRGKYRALAPNLQFGDFYCRARRANYGEHNPGRRPMGRRR